MMNPMVYEKLEELYKSFLIIKEPTGDKNYICRAGDTDVTVTTG